MARNVSTGAPPLTFTIEELCRAAGCSPRTFHRLRARGDGPAIVKLGNRTVIRRKTAKRWLARRETIATRTDPRELQLDVVRDYLLSIVGAPEDSAKVAEWASDALDALAETRGIAPKRQPAVAR